MARLESQPTSGSAERRPTSRAHGLVALALLIATPAAADDWVRVRTADLEILSDVGPVAAVEASVRLERLRAALGALFPGSAEDRRPLTLVLIGTRSPFEELVPERHPRPGVVEGFFQSGGERDYAVVHFDGDRPYPFDAAEHEVAHLALNAALPAQPVWVAEGLAELLSGAIIARGEVLLGTKRSGHEALLAREALLPLPALLAVGHDSPEYLATDSRILYAESWALARWAVHRGGLVGLRLFLDALARGGDVTAAFEHHFGPVAVAEATLGDVPSGPIFRIPVAAHAGAAVRTDVPPDGDVHERLGGLLLAGGRTERAAFHFATALAADPGHVAARTGLARVLGHQGRWSEAGRALDAFPGPAALLERARLRVDEGLARGEPLPPEVRDRLVADLESVLRQQPRNLQAALLLTRLEPRPYAERIAVLQPLFDAQPDRVALAQTLSHLHVKNRDLSAARRVLREARAATEEPAYRFLFDRLLGRIGGFEAQTAEVRGRLVELECPSDGSLRFTIASDFATIRLEAASTRSFFIADGGDGRDQRRLVCGEQDLPLEVRYQRTRSALDPRVAGQVVWVSFDPPRDRRRP